MKLDAGAVIPRRHFLAFSANRMFVVPVNTARAVLMLAAGCVAVSCSPKSEINRTAKSEVEATTPNRPGAVVQSEGESEDQPDEDQIAEDCVAFVRGTKAVPAQAGNGDCPGCSAAGTEVLRFQQMETERVACSRATCEIVVTIRAFFNPGSGERVAGGLTGWIPPEQRSEYLRGNTPAGEQAYRVKIIYRRTGAAWRAVEFDKADSK